MSRGIEYFIYNLKSFILLYNIIYENLFFMKY